MLVATPDLVEGILTDLITTVTSGSFSGVFHGSMIALSTAALPTGVSLPYADVTLPTYSGYADASCAITGPVRLDDGDFGLIGAEVSFNQASTITPTVIFGYALYKPGTPNLVLAVENFVTPKDLNDAFDFLIFNPVIDIPITTIGAAVIVN
jgi:hypothetical protein